VVIFIFATLIEAFFIITPLYYARYVYRQIEDRGERWLEALRALGFRKTPFWRAAGLVLAGFVLIVVVNLGYSMLLEWIQQIRPDLHLQTNDEFVCQENKFAPISTAAQLLVAFAIAPICEEIFFRGFVFMGLRSRMTLVGAIFFSSLIFAVAHADATSFPILFVIGLVLAYLRWNTCSIWPGIVLHMLNNGISAAVIVGTCR
jgi:membrane protease YdiL (CAAX protease family)